jgi:glycerol uptake facilitator-like aquaporin
MATLKTLLTFMLLGAFLGLAMASWLAPKVLEWDNSNRYQSTQTLCDLPQIIRNVSADLLRYQFIGTLVGTGVFLVLGIVFVVWRNKRTRRMQQPPTTPAAA